MSMSDSWHSVSSPSISMSPTCRRSVCVAGNKTGVPQTLIPRAIMQYVRTHYPQDVVTKFSKKDYGYKLELSDDMDLRFNHQCQFIGEID